MARCPFAEWKPISGGCGPYASGPFKIVHHTTEGSNTAAAFEAFRSHKSDPHFTVDGMKIYQHVDTSNAARALRNPPGGVETNKESAIQIELVGFAGSRKNPAALKNLARLCRWIEAEHGVARVWPNGPPKVAVNGRDPGGHNRNAETWQAQSGHFGHCHVPENTHWDPAFDRVEAEYVMSAEFSSSGALTNADVQQVRALVERQLPAVEPDPEVIIDHADVGESGGI
jgi:hypothetical protein